MKINISIDSDINSGKSDEVANRYGWTMGEVKLARKLYSSEQIVKGLTYHNKDIQAIWGQVTLLQGDKRLDLMIFTPTCIFVFEVKDGKDTERDDVKPWTNHNAWTQCRTYVDEVRNKSNNLMPIQGIVVLSNISKHSELAEGIKNHNSDSNMTTWYQEDLNRGNIEQLLKAAEQNNQHSDFQITEFAPFCAINAIIQEISIKKEVECSRKIILNLLDREQSSMVFRPSFTGNRIVYGVAGSGKTLMIIQKAIQLSKILERDEKILVVCYNKPLQVYLDQILKPYYNKGNLVIRTIHAWHRYVLGYFDDPMHKQLKLDLERNDPNSTNEYFEEIPKLVNSILKKKKVKHNLQYHSILIDEGQDFDKLWFENLNLAYNKTDQSIFMVCLDGVQNISTRKVNRFTWKSMGISVSGRVVYLRKNYRNAERIAQYAMECITVSENLGNDDIMKELEMKEFGVPGGRVVTNELHRSGFIKYVAKVIDNIPSEKSIMIVQNIPAPGTILDIQQHLQSNRKRLVDGVVKRINAIPDETLIPVYSVYRSKGLEADVVIYLNSFDDQERKNYVAYTRARELLYDFYIKYPRRR